MADRPEDTELAALRLAISERPGDMPVRARLATLLPRAEALDLLHQGAWFAAGRADYLQALAAGYEAVGAVADAVEALEQAMRVAPGDGGVAASLAGLWARLGEGEKSRRMAERAASLGADSVRNPAVDGPTPLLVRGLFDQYAGRFDDHLSGALHYRAPQELAAMIGEYAPARLGRVLDLGCGTGLMAPHLRQAAAHLAGIDLSPAMLAQAAKRGLYDTLVEAEAVAYLSDCPPFDLIMAADVLVYIGDLAPLFAAVKRALVPGSQFFATVETHFGDGFALTPARRYAHSHIYIECIARSVGLELFGWQAIVPRHDAGKPVEGARFGLC